MDAAGGSGAPADELFPELAAERAHLAHARRARDRMVERLARVDPHGAADEITAEYVEMTVAEALADLAAPGAGDFFGRIDTVEATRGAVRSERWYIGRRHIEDDDHEPMVVDWRAPVSAPFYRATAADALGVSLRRRFTLERGGQAASFRGEVPVRPEARDELRGPLNERGGQAASFRGEVPVRPEARDELRGPLNERGAGRVVQG